MSAEEELNQERRITFCMYECWEKLAVDARLPALKSMNREEIAPFKKNLVLIDLRSGHDNPTFQVIGSELQEDLDEDLSNKHVSNVPRRTMLSRVTDHYLEVMANRVPIAFEAEFVNTDSEKALYRGILLPFSDDGENINFILGGVRWILEKDVTLDDSKPTIEELMRSISSGREDAPVQYDEAAVAAEQDTPDTVAEDYTDPDADTLNEDLDEDMALSEDDFDAVGEEDELDETGEDAADDIDLAAEALMEDDDQTEALTPVEGSDSEMEELIENIDEETELSEDGFDVVADADPVEAAGDEPIIETDALEDVAPEDPVIADDAFTSENAPSFLTDTPGITRKDFVPSADEETAEEAEDEAELISDVEGEILADPEQKDDSEIFAETEQPDETLFNDAEDESDAVSDEGNFAEIFDTEDETIKDDVEATTEDNLAPVEEDALSFVESLEKELYGHSDEIEIDGEEASDATGEEQPPSDGETDMEAEAILEDLEEKDALEEAAGDPAPMSDEPEEELAVENAEEFIAEDDDAYAAKSLKDLTLNELLLEDTADDDVDALETGDIAEETSDAEDAAGDLVEEDVIEEDPDAWEDAEADEAADAEAINEQDLIVEEATEDAPEEDGASELVLEDEYLEIEDSDAFEDKIVEEFIDGDDLNIPENLEESKEPAPESAATDQVDVITESSDTQFIERSDDDLSIEELMESIISERNFEQSHDIEDDEAIEEAIEAVDAAVPEMEPADDEEDVVEDIVTEEGVVENIVASSAEDAEEDLAENFADNSINETSQNQDVADTPAITEVGAVLPQEIEQEPLSVNEAEVELEDVAQAPIETDVPEDKMKKSSVIERAMAMMAPNFSRPNEPVLQDIPDTRSVEITKQSVTVDITTAPMDDEDPAMGSVEISEEDITADVMLEPMDDDDLTMDSSEFEEDAVTGEVAPEPGFADQAAGEEIENDDGLSDEPEDAQSTADAQSKSLEELRATLKQIVGYIKKEDKNHNRSRDSLYNILTAIYEFHDTCEGSTDAYNTIVTEHGLKVQSRAPFTPVLKICLGKDYDKTRLTEYAAALGIARYMNVDISEFHAFIKNFPGGIKGCVKEMRAIRKHGTSGNIAARKTRSIEEAREILRDMAPIASFRLKKIIVGNNVDEFCLLLAKRDGHDINVLKILDEKYTKLDPVIKRAAFIKGNLNDRK